MRIKKVGFLLFDGFNAQDLTGPLEAFHTVSNVTASPYEFVYIGASAGPCKTESGLAMIADYSVKECPPLDTLFIPGGAGSRNASVQADICSWLQTVKPDTRRLVSVCTGAFLLAEAGLLDGLGATTHWQFTDQLQARYPAIRVHPGALFVDNGEIATSAGITAGIDLALSLIELDMGATVATQVARYLVVHYQRAGDQAQFSAPLQFQQKASSPFASLTGYVLQNLHHSMGVSDLADFCKMSERNFFRRFSQQMGTSPAQYIEALRLDYARQLLTEKPWPVTRIGEACGYKSTDAFRRAFTRKFAIAPGDYRARFSKHH